MRILLIFLAVFSNLFATTLLTHNIYERSDRIDIMLSFDSPFNGSIKESKFNGGIAIILSDLAFEQNIDKNINSKILQNISLDSKDGVTRLELRSTDEVSVSASKTTDGFGLRIRAVLANQTSPKQILTPPVVKKDESIVDFRYFAVVLTLFALFIFLYLFSKFLKNRKFGSKFSINKLDFTNQSEVKILFQKHIDNVNKVVLISYLDKKYLVLSGNSNVLLEKFGENGIESEGEFEAFFQENRQKLDNFLKETTQLTNYKNKIAEI